MSDTFILGQISDLHIKAPGKLSYRVVDCAAMLARCVQEILRLPQRPDALVITEGAAKALLASSDRGLRSSASVTP